MLCIQPETDGCTRGGLLSPHPRLLLSIQKCICIISSFTHPYFVYIPHIPHTTDPLLFPSWFRILTFVYNLRCAEMEHKRSARRDAKDYTLLTALVQRFQFKVIRACWHRRNSGDDANFLGVQALNISANCQKLASGVATLRIGIAVRVASLLSDNDYFSFSII